MPQKDGRCFQWIATLFIMSCFGTSSTLGQDEFPKLDTSNENDLFKVKENSTLGTYLGWIEVTNGKELRLQTSSDFIKLTRDATHSDVTRLRMDILLNTKLDYDQGSPFTSIDIRGSNSDYTVKRTINIIILDVNDEVPIFVNLPYSVTVAEDHPSGPLGYSLIQAKDRDKTDTLSYSIQNAGDKDPFLIDPTNGTISLQGELDYEEKRFYHYNLKVHDEAGHSDSTDLFITVLDVQDTPPSFSSPTYRADVTENSPNGLKVIEVRVWDGDRGVSNSVSFGLTNESCPGLFAVDPNTGWISLKSSPDRDSGAVKRHGGRCDMGVKATEGNEHPQIKGNFTTEALVVVTISDVNDNGPTFSSSRYTADIDENTQQSMLISLHSQLEVTDIDQGENAVILVSITTLQSYFEVEPSTVQSVGDISIRIKDSSILDYEKHQTPLTIKLEAVDSSKTFSSTTEILLTINNMNDNTPKFEQRVYSAYIDENSGIGTYILTIKADDADISNGGNNFGKVTYSIEDNDQSFHINQTSGAVTASRVFDKEKRDLYFLTIVAEDGGQRQSRAPLTVRIKDVNDNHPMFVMDQYQTSLEERSLHLSNPVVVYATDKDEAGTPYADVSYKLLASAPLDLHQHFRMDPKNGSLSVKTKLDYESIIFPGGKEGMITLHVVAFDGGTPPLSSSTTIVISLLDVNDHDPTCQQPVYSKSVPEDSRPGTSLLSVKAYDDDATQPNNIYFFGLDMNSLSAFSINSQTGVISTVSTIDRETKSSYSVTVYVTDRGMPSRSSHCSVNITVTDINDQVPTFSEARYEQRIKENSKLSWRCNATDPDTDSRLVYSVDWDKSSGHDGAGTVIDQSELKLWLEIDSQRCLVTSKKDLDRERVEQITLQIQVEDKNGKINTPQKDTSSLLITVLDVNDETPQFEKGPHFTASVRENTHKGNQIYLDDGSTLNVVDKDGPGVNSEYNLSLLNYKNVFQISPTSGHSKTAVRMIIVSDDLDYEKVKSYELKLVATESHTTEKLHSTSTVTVSILNENDNIPKFIGGPFHAAVPENSHSSTSVIDITASDDDIGDFGKYHFSLTDDQSDPGKFHIDNVTGLVTVTGGGLDWEVKHSYTMSVTVTDTGGFFSRTQLTISLVDLNDNSPKFLKKQYTATIKENQIDFVPALVVQATDEDEPGNKNSRITYTLSGVPRSVRSIFKIDSQSGEITLNNYINFETLRNERGIHNGKISMTVTAKDGGSPPRSDRAQLVVTVQDSNDNPPKFDRPLYTIALPENAKTGYLITEVHAKDSDKTNNKVSYRIDTLSNDTFKIDPESGNITLKRKLDREAKSSYSIQVTASDNGLPSRASNAVVKVEITDVNDETPKFEKSRYDTSLQENNNLTWTCHATDPDEDSRLVYSIDWDKSSGQDGAGSVIDQTQLQAWIEMESGSCLVKSKKPLDREKVNKMTLQIQVEDKAGKLNTPQIDTATLSIDVEDVNDETPQFENGPDFTASVRENTPKESQIYLDDGSVLTVIDKDSLGNNSEFSVSLLNHTDIFQIRPGTGHSRTAIRLYVTKDDALDYEKTQTYTLQLVTTETRTRQKLSSTSTVTVSIQNENDNIPQFIGGPFTATVPENSKKDTSVITITAKDNDLPPFKQFSYSIEDSENSNVFQINKDNGLVTVSPGAVLDREVKPYVSVTDTGGFSSRSQLTVSISDMNDNAPIFDQKHYSATIKENQKIFVPPLFAQATDGDKPGNKNSNLTYSLSSVPHSLPSKFHMDPQSGEISLTSPLDFEHLNMEPGVEGGKISLTVRVVDGGNPPRNDTAQVVIKVEDENDIPPVFENLVNSTTVPENATQGSLIAEVHARDLDKTNNKVSYIIDTLSADTFTMDRVSGRITLTGKLDRETKSHYSIRVTAFDTGVPPRTATAVIKLEVADINDEAPAFEKSRYDTSLQENRNLEWTCHATDPDEDSRLVYSIDWDKSSGQDGAGSVINQTQLQTWIEIKSDSCLVKSKKRLDREKVNKMTIQIQVEDKAGKLNTPQKDTAILYINVEDVNDETPHFENGPHFTASVRENTPKASQIYLDDGSVLTVVDKDSLGINSEFSVSLLNHTDIFQIRPGTGHSRTAIRLYVIKDDALDYEKTQTYTLQIVTTETNTHQKLSSTSTVTVSIQNENDNIPQFIGGPFTATVPENSKKDTSVITIKAIDDDLSPFKKFVFSIEDSEDKNIFQINKASGLVTVSPGAVLDREVKPSYTLYVSVTDTGGFSSRSQLTVSISDMNDNSPIFDQKQYSATIKENQENFVPPLFARATDGDEPGNKNSNLTYSLSPVPHSLPSKFHMDPQSGEISLTSPLDFEHLNKEPGVVGVEISLTVRVVDGGNPPRSDTAQVLIKVEDENDIPPVFENLVNSTTVPENATKGAFIAEVHARDLDETNNKVSYIIDTLSADTFTMDRVSGRITLTGKLDRETKSHYSIRVTAFDTGVPPRTATAVIKLEVVDVNDEAPAFEKSRYDTSLLENKNLNWTCHATDPDEDSRLVYSIDWDKSSGQDGAGSVIDQTQLKAWIAMESDKCSVKSKKPLDREKVNKMTLQIQVEDKAGQLNTPQIDTATVSINVEDVNDERPQFENGHHFTASVRENTPKESQIYLNDGSVLTVVDKDSLGINSEFSVSLLNHTDIFQIRPGTGHSRTAIKLYVTKDDALDYEKTQTYTLELVTTETRTHQKLSSTSTVTVSIQNENDNIPQFIGGPFTATVPENSKKDTSVIIIKAKDNDLPPFKQFSYSIEDSENSNAFQINKASGLVTVSPGAVLDREVKPSYTLYVSVTDTGGFSSRSQLTVSISDMNDNAPIFDQKHYSATIKENKKIFVPPLFAQATDGDEPGNKNSNLTYSLSSIPHSPPSKFHMDPQSGEISLTSPLDFEHLNKEPGVEGGKISLTVRVVDGGNPQRSDTAQVVIKVEDENDIPPVFENLVNSTTVPENATKDTLIVDVHARDLDKTNNKVSYIIDTLSGDTFTMDRVSGRITLTGKLDRETKSHYSIRVTAFDTGVPPRTATAVIKLEVVDVNDEAPAFEKSRYETSLQENKNLLWTCHATDPDEESRLVYSIDWDKSSGQDGAGSVIDQTQLKTWIEMESGSCSVKSKKPLDRENVNKMTLQIQVEDKAGKLNTPQIDTATLSINVEDVNDERPQFVNGPNFTASVRENTPKESQIYLDDGSVLTVVDKDSLGNNSEFSVSLLNHTDIFQIRPGTGHSRTAIRLYVTKDDTLDYEKTQTYTLQLVTTETKTRQKLSSTSTVTVSIQNENDNIPQFIGGPFTATVPENSKKDTSVITIKAQDNDLPPFKKFVFSIEDPENNNRFQINKASGLVTVSPGAVLDREVKPSYTLYVSVTDTGGFSSRSQLTVSISDMNDNSPIFDQKQYSATIKENQKIFAPPLFAQATDGDEPGNKNSNLTYSLSSIPDSLRSKFHMDPQSGEISLTSSLDFEHLNKEPGVKGGKISLTVRVVDGGNPPRNDTAQVVIKVEDENDIPPVFENLVNSTTVPENATTDTLIAEVHARDLDKTNNKVSYIIDTLSADTFTMDGVSGRITLTGKLDRETKSHYSIRVTAFDTGVPPRTATAVIKLKVVDVNDEAPAFEKSRYDTSLQENKNLKWTCNATDPDEDSRLVYSIDWNKSSGQDGAGSVIDQTQLKAWIEIERDSCLVKSKKPLDREKVNKMTLQIQVEDMAGVFNTPQKDTASLSINVEDVNDETPQFVNGPHFTASVRENTPKDSQIYLNDGSVLTVVDKDSLGINSEFSVSLLNHTDIFQIRPGTGHSRTAIRLYVTKDGALDYEKTQTYTLQLVTAETRTRQKLSSTSTVTVSIQNENDNIPQFIGGPFTATVPENSKKDTSVITIRANDNDLPPFKQFSYSIEDSENSNAFQINKASGLVTVSPGAVLDREVKPSYTLYVSVTDTGGFSSRSQLTVSISDMNDNAPIFDQKQYSATIKENQENFVPSLFAEATDGDEPGNKNSNLTYSLSPVPDSLPSKFHMNPQSGEISLISPLDFEHLNKEPGVDGGEISLTVRVVDGGNPQRSDTAQVVIKVEDENDIPPVFENLVNSTTVPENATKDTLIAEVHARDLDKTNNKVSYIIDTLSADTFTMDRVSGRITLTGKLDRETKSHYSIRVTAFDTGVPPRTATAVINLEVVDVNDEAPAFEKSRYEQNLDENQNFTWTCHVTDPDKDSRLVYSIDWDKSSGQDGAGSVVTQTDLRTWIEMERDKCSVKSKKPLDRERLNKMTLQINVEDKAGQLNTPQIDTVTLYVTILDVNDEPPHFENGPQFTASVSENTPKSQIYMDKRTSLDVIDKDEPGINSDFDVFLLNHTDIFQIQPSSGKYRQDISLFVIKNDAFDYEEVQSYTLEILVIESNTSQKLCSTSTITLNIQNENDNVPQFIGGPFNATVPENSKKNTSVTTIMAYDEDFYPFGNYSFSLDDLSYNEIFQIDKDSGLVTVATDEVLNREVTSSYTLYVTVTDSGGLSSRSQLIVSISDMNDNSPIFDQKNYSVSIRENEDKFVPAFFLHATDGDEPGNKNSNLTYSLSSVPHSLPSKFHMDPQSGEISLISPLDFEHLNKEPGVKGGKISLTVKVVDGGNPPRNDTAQVVIKVEDENDIPPVFENLVNSTTVPENATKGQVVMELEVYDGDGTSPYNLTYCIIQSGALGRFKIDSSCVIQVDQKLDREERDQYMLTVVAVDKGIVSYTATTTIHIILLDINDTPPSLVQSNFEVDVWENEILSTTVLNFTAFDDDLSSSLSFTLLTDESVAINEKNHVLPYEHFKDWFSVSSYEDTAMLKVNSSLDRELAQTLVLKIAVTDDNAESNLPQSVTATVTVALRDVNDNPPMFSTREKTLSLKVSEATQRHSEITTLSATDADQDQTVTFTLQQADNMTYFDITPSGKLTLYQPLNRETTQFINFTVIATDSGHPSQSSSLPVHVTVLDVNDNDPEFDNASYTFRVWENSNTTTAVGSVHATDRDAGQNANVTYFFQDETYFRIEKLTGQIFVNGEIDREKDRKFTLTVGARDNPALDEPRKASTTITIHVLDRNDNDPQFQSDHYTASIVETRRNNTILSVKPPIQVTDQDKDENADISYFFVNESSYFDIKERSGEVYITSKDLRGLGGSYVFVIEARDHGHPARSSLARLSVTIQDENLNNPVFVRTGPLPVIPECAREGTLIYTFQATDADKNKANNGKVVYSLIQPASSSNDSRLLHIDPASGELTLVGKLDSETNKELVFQVKAEDRGLPARRNNISDLIHMNVQDINDNPPVFQTDTQSSFSVDENYVGAGVAFVQATDPDKNSSLRYTLKGEFKDHFSIETKADQSGEISIVRGLDREELESLTLSVDVEDATSVRKYAVCDDYQGPQTRDERDVTIHIRDVNDNPPWFIRKQLSKGFLSTTDFGSFILDLSEFVEDNDTEAVNHHQYKLEDTQADSPVNLRWTNQEQPRPITITPNGSVVTNFAFSEDAKGVFRLTVGVYDESAGNDTVALRIYVVSDSQTVHMTYGLTEDQLRTKVEFIVKILSASGLGYQFVADNILPVSADEGTIDGSRSVLVVHAVDDKGNVVNGDDLLSDIDRSRDLIDALIDRYHVLKTEVGDSTLLKKDKDTEIRLQYILIAVIGLLTISFVIALFFLLHNIQRFKRKLKAQTIDVHGMDTIIEDKFPGLDNNIKESNPIFMRDDITAFDETDFKINNHRAEVESISSKNSLDQNEVGSLPSYNASQSDQEEQEATVDFGSSSNQHPVESKSRRFIFQTPGHTNRAFHPDQEYYYRDADNDEDEEDDDGIIRTEELIINSPDDYDDDDDGSGGQNEDGFNIELDVSQLECTDI